MVNRFIEITTLVIAMPRSRYILYRCFITLEESLGSAISSISLLVLVPQYLSLLWNLEVNLESTTPLFLCNDQILSSTS